MSTLAVQACCTQRHPTPILRQITVPLNYFLGFSATFFHASLQGLLCVCNANGANLPMMVSFDTTPRMLLSRYFIRALSVTFAALGSTQHTRTGYSFVARLRFESPDVAPKVARLHGPAPLLRTARLVAFADRLWISLQTTFGTAQLIWGRK